MAKQFTLRDDPEFRDADDKLQEVRVQRGELQTRIDELVGNQNVAAKDHATALQSQAEAVLASDGGSAVATLPPRTADDIGIDLGTKYTQLEILNLAVTTQEGKVEKLKQGTSVKWCKENRSDYIERVRRVHAAIKELAKAADAEREYRESANDAGIAFDAYFRPPHLGIEWSLKCRETFEPQAVQRLQEIELDFPELRGTIYRRKQLDVPGWG